MPILAYPESSIILVNNTISDVDNVRHGLFPKLPSITDAKYYGIKDGSVVELGFLLATGVTTGATSQSQVFTNGITCSDINENRIPFAGANGKLTSSNNLTYTPGTGLVLSSTSDADWYCGFAAAHLSGSPNIFCFGVAGPDFITFDCISANNAYIYAAATGTDLVITVDGWTRFYNHLMPTITISPNGTVNITTLNSSKPIFTDSSGNLTSTGIGTSSQFIKGDGSLDSSTYLASLSGALLATGATTGATSQAQVFTNGVTLSNMTLGSVLFAGTAGVVSQDNTNFFWDNTNKRLGIGTAAPGNLLEINGVGYAYNISGGQLSLSSTVAYNLSPTAGIHFILNTNGAGDRFPLGEIAVTKENTSADNYASFMSLWTTIAAGTGVERMRITSAGNVGIGTTAPTGNLHIEGVDKGTTNLYAGGNLNIYTTDALAADKGGSISLGAVQNELGTKYGFAAIKGANADGIAGNVAGYLSFFTSKTAVGSVERMRIDTTGNVGIGTTAPAAKLDVAGSIQNSSAVASTLGGYVRTFSEATGTPSGTSVSFDIAVNIPTSCRLLGIQLRVDTALTAGETWHASLWYGSSYTLLGFGQLVAKNTKINCMIPVFISTDTCYIRITRDSGNFTNGVGVIRAVCYYETFTGMGDL